MALVFSGTGHILMTYPWLPWSFAMRALHGFGDGLILAVGTYTTISRLFHVERIGGSASLMSLTTTLGVLTGSLLFGAFGGGLRLRHAPHGLRGRQPGAAPSGLCGFKGGRLTLWGKYERCPCPHPPRGSCGSDLPKRRLKNGGSLPIRFTQTYRLDE